MTGNWNTSVDRTGLSALYADWLDLIPHLMGRFKLEWPKEEVRPHIDCDEVDVFWRLGKLGVIHWHKGQVCFSSATRRQLQELDAGIPDLEFHEVILPLKGWKEDEGTLSDIEYTFRNFWATALQEARLYWAAGQVAESKLGEIR